MSERKPRENVPESNLTITFEEWDSEYLNACNACWLYQGELNLDDGRFEQCLCGKDGCPLVWCRKPDPGARRESCAELRHLHEKMGVSEDIMFGEAGPGTPAEEILVARYLCSTLGRPCPNARNAATPWRSAGTRTPAKISCHAPISPDANTPRTCRRTSGCSSQERRSCRGWKRKRGQTMCLTYRPKNRPAFTRLCYRYGERHGGHVAGEWKCREYPKPADRRERTE